MSDLNTEDSDDDLPQLSAHALAALQEFYDDQSSKLKALSTGFKDAKDIELGENWQLSQFWYDDNTARTLAEEVIREANGGRIACLCAPTLYKELLKLELAVDCKQAVLFEYDKRFSIYGDNFTYYDYNAPLDIESSIKEKSFDIVFADPPFLSEECLSKVTQTIKYLAKGKIILCTGLIMQAHAKQLLDLSLCKFQPRHSRNLANEFGCFINYDSKLNEGD